MMKLTHLMNYQPLGTRAMDHFILEYDRQAKARDWHVTFGFTAPPPASMTVEHFVYDPRNICIEPCNVLQTSFHSVFEKQILNLKRRGFAKKLAVIDHSSGEGPKRDWKTPLRRWRGHRVGKIVDAITCVSDFNKTRQVWRVFLPWGKVHVVHNGIDLAQFPFELNDMEEINFVGQLIPQKGVATLLEALKLIQDPWPCRIAGAGPQRGELEALAAGLPVTFLGHVADVRQCYRGIVVVPSLWAEAFGLVVIEAMACGAAVIVSSAGALREVVGERAGLVFQAGNAGDLAAKLDILIADSHKRSVLAKAGRQRVEVHFQLKECVTRHLDIIASLD
jgi:glycosyltransferase involved in cell wall biosynthesis